MESILGRSLVLAAGLSACLSLAFAGQEAAAPADPWFEEVTAAAGIATRHTNRAFRNPYAEIMAGYTALGAAVAVGDFDGDGWEDLFVTDTADGAPNHLFRNLTAERGRLAFADVAREAGVAAGNDERNATTDALWLDYDGDGRQDLFVVRCGRSLLFHNEGRGRFREVSREAGLGAHANALAAIAFDADRDGRLDLLVGSYFQPVDLFRPETPRFFPESLESAQNGGGVTFYRNLGPDGSGRVRFAEETAAAGLAQSGWTLDVGHGDADGDGDEDLYVACDFGTDRFFVNESRPGAPRFRDVTAAALGFDTKKGMNAEWGDYDGDGRPDVYVTNITDDYMREGNFLWRNEGPAPDGGGPRFTDVGRETGTHDTGWGWGGKFLDYDNDGWLDLYVANGWVSAGPESYVPVVFEMILRGGADLADVRSWPPMGDRTLSGYQKNRLFHNQGGLFRDEAPRHGLDSVRDGRGVAVADLDRDGRQDLFVANADDAPHLFRNRLPTGARWVAFQLEGRRSNRDAVGARLELMAGGRRLIRWLDGGNGFAAQSSRRVHFGLGDAERAEALEIRWPSGERQRFAGFAAGRLYRIVEGEPELRELSPKRERRLAGAASAEAPASLAQLERALAAAPHSQRAASDYRMAVIRAGQYDRAIEFFERLVAAHPRSANAWLNYGYAYVDKIPVAGSISRVILANQSLEKFTRSIELEKTWLALYTRGNGYLYWPPVFGKAKLAVADLEQAMALVEREPKQRPVHARVYVALGDAYWRTDQPAKARAVWREGAARFSGEPRLQGRLARDGDELSAYLYDQLDPNERVDTSLAPLWAEN